MTFLLVIDSTITNCNGCYAYKSTFKKLFFQNQKLFRVFNSVK